MNKQEIRDLMRLFDKSGITKVKIKDGDFSIELQKGFEGGVSIAPSVAQSAPVVQAVSKSADEEVAPKQVGSENSLSIKSPMVGTFYAAPSPGSDPFVKVGDTVRKGQTVAIIEAMKIMNEIEAEFDCKITAVLAEDGEPVEFDMPLFSVEKV